MTNRPALSMVARIPSIYHRWSNWWPTARRSDTDAVFDVYERQATVVTHVSKGSSGGNGNFIVTFAGISQDGLSVFLQSAEQLEPGDTDAAQDVFRATLAGYPRPAGASPLRVPLVPAYVQCTSRTACTGPPTCPVAPNPTARAPRLRRCPPTSPWGLPTAAAGRPTPSPT